MCSERLESFQKEQLTNWLPLLFSKRFCILTGTYQVLWVSLFSFTMPKTHYPVHASCPYMCYSHPFLLVHRSLFSSSFKFTLGTTAEPCSPLRGSRFGTLFPGYVSALLILSYNNFFTNMPPC